MNARKLSETLSLPPSGSVGFADRRLTERLSGNAISTHTGTWSLAPGSPRNVRKESIALA